MTDEEYFRKNNPDFCYGERPLSPYWDLFQDGVEFGERQSEQKIEELENKKAGLEERCEISQDEVSRLIQENTELKKINSETLTQLNLDNGELIIENEKLRKENAELRNNGFTVSAMTEQQLKVAIGKGKQLEKENKKVKQGCHKWFMRWREVKREELEVFSKIEELEKENAELKKQLEESDNATDCFNKQEEIIAKAKKIIGNLYEMIKRPYQFTAPRKIQMVSEAEQFLKEIEK